MGLTANFYNHSTVGATALYAIQNANCTLAYKCFNELLYSGEEEYAYQIAILAWLLGPPSGSKSYAYAHSSRSHFINIVCHNTVAYELSPLSIEKPLQNPHIQSALGAINAALKRKDIYRALYLSRPYHTDLKTLLELLHLPMAFVNLCDELLFAPLLDRLVIQAFAYKLNPSPPTLKELPSTKGRCFTVDSTACALWGANLPPRPMNPAVVFDEPTAYWQTAIKKYNITKHQGRLVFLDDSSEEEFYGKYFSSDLPDEWSMAEQMKSHGLTAMEATENVWRTAFLLL